jgi:hypothetical protein
MDVQKADTAPGDVLMLQGSEEGKVTWRFAISTGLNARIEGRPPTVEELANALRNGIPMAPLILVDVLAALAVAVAQRDLIAARLRELEPTATKPFPDAAAMSLN